MKKGVASSLGSSLDFLSHPVGFNVRGQPAVKTKVGVLFSIICLGLFVTLSWVTIANYLDTSRPVISYETVTLKAKEPANIKQSKLYPIIFFLDQVNYLTPEELAKYVNPYIIYYSKPTVGAVAFERLKLVPCKDLIARGKTDTITVESEGSVKTNYKQHGYCIDDEDKEFMLGDDNAIDLFSLALYPCALTDGSCKSPTELGKLAASISFPQAVTNFGDYKSPITYVTESSDWVGLNTYFWVVTYHSLKTNEVMQERGFLSKIETTHRFVSEDKTTSQVRNRDSAQTTCPEAQIDNCLPYLVHNFLMTNKKMKIVRSYKGIVESISEIGGLTDLIFMVFVLLYSVYHRTATFEFLIKEIYGLDKPRSSLCKKKNKAEVQAVGAEADSIDIKVYEKAKVQVEKDLDIVAFIEEMNVIKLFLMESFGLQFPGNQERFSDLRHFHSIRPLYEPEKNLNPNGTELGRQFSLNPQNSAQPRSGTLVRENSGFTKPQAVFQSPDISPNRQIKYKKSIVLCTIKKPPQEQLSRFAQPKPETDSKMQVSEVDFESEK
jgi:hypothetical protein